MAGVWSKLTSSTRVSLLKQTAAVVVGLAFFVLVDGPARDLRGCPAWKAVIYLFVYVGLVASLVFMYLSRRRWIRWPCCLLVAVTLSVHFGFMRVMGEGFTFDTSLLALGNMENTSQAIATYWRMALPVILICFALALAVSWLLVRYVVSFGGRLSLLTIPFLACMGFVIWWSTGRTNTFATPFRVPGILAYQLLGYYHGPRSPAVLSPKTAPFSHLIIIVDESIKASHLEINGYSRSTCPYLKSIQDQLCNLGIASAAGNASYTSQAALFAGVVPSDLPDKDFVALKKPSIAQYAAKAGYRFAFFDGQLYKRLIVTAQQACTPDSFSYFRGPGMVRHEYEVDGAMAEKLVSWIEENDRTVSYVAKHGAHYPYEMSYPQDRKVFQPTVDGAAWSDDAPKNRNSYDNAVLWSCDHFFELLLPRLEILRKDIVLIYTSDHGQVLPGTVLNCRVTHAIPGLPSASAEVPLLIWGAGEGREVVRQLCANPTIRDNASHFEVFPAMLRLMGYDREEVRKLYGQGLFDDLPVGRQRLYLGGMIENPGRSRMELFRPETLKEDEAGGK